MIPTTTEALLLIKLSVFSWTKLKTALAVELFNKKFKCPYQGSTGINKVQLWTAQSI